MPARRTTDLKILIAALTATVVLSVASYLISPVSSTPAIDGSTFATHPGGAKATFLALRAAGYDVRQSYEPLATLRGTAAQSVWIVADPNTPPSQQDLAALVRFVEAGGTVLGTGHEARQFLPGLAAPGAPADADAAVVAAAVPSRLSAGVPEIVMTPSASGLPDDSKYLVIYGTMAKPAVVAARLGRGQAIWWSGSTPLSNAGITAPGHVELLVNVLGQPGARAILWDEHYHGHTRSFLSYVADTPIPYAGAQLGLVLVLALAAFGRRTWPVREQHVEPRTSPLEFVDSMGSLYHRAKAAAGAVATVRARVRRALVATSGLPPDVADDRLSRACAARMAMDAATIESALTASAAAAANPHLSGADARAVVARLQGVGAAVTTARRATRGTETRP